MKLVVESQRAAGIHHAVVKRLAVFNLVPLFYAYCPVNVQELHAALGPPAVVGLYQFLFCEPDHHGGLLPPLIGGHYNRLVVGSSEGLHSWLVVLRKDGEFGLEMSENFWLRMRLIKVKPGSYLKNSSLSLLLLFTR